MLAYLRDRSAQTIVRAATLRQKLQVKLPISPTHGVLTPGPTSPSDDPLTPDAWQGSHWSTSLEVKGMTPSRTKSTAKSGIEARCAAVEADALPQGRRGGVCSTDEGIARKPASSRESFVSWVHFKDGSASNKRSCCHT